MHNKPLDDVVDVRVGDHVMIKDQMSKLKPREKFVVIDPKVNDTHVTVQKQDKKFLARQYDVAKHQLLKVPRQAALKAKQKIKNMSHLYQLGQQNPIIPTHAFDLNSFWRNTQM